MLPRPTLILADDHQLLLDSLRKVLEPRYQVVATVNNGRDLLTATRDSRPDAILLDLHMPELNGLDAARQLRKVSPRTKIIVLTMDDDPVLAQEVLEVGAAGYLLKTAEADELIKAIDHVLLGGKYVTGVGQERLPRSRGTGGHAPGDLTPRQREVLQLVAEGHSMKQIAGKLGVSARTVAFHKYGVMEALGVTSTAELVRHAIRRKLISV